MKRVLVLGGFGFLGSHLVELLLDDGARVHVVDDHSSCPIPPEALGRELGSRPHLTNSATTGAAFLDGGGDGKPFDEVYHLASLVGPAGILPHAGKIGLSIVDDLAKVVGASLDWGARLVFVSSSEVYGGGRGGLCREGMAKTVPPAPSPRLEYALGKLTAEVMMINSCRARGLEGCVVRPFNIGGPRQSGRGGFVLPRFIGQALEGLPLTVFGDGHQVRAFTHVRDMAEGLIAAMFRGRSGEVYNLGNPANRCSILELAREVVAATGSASDLQFVDPREIYGPLYAEADDKYPDIAKAEAELDWRPTSSRQQTIADTVAYMRGLSPALLAEVRGF